MPGRRPGWRLAALALVRDTKPEIRVTDIGMPPTDTTEGFDAARVNPRWAARHRDPRSVRARRRRARDGAAGQRRSIGYLLKSRVTADFVDTMQRIVHRASVVDPALIEELVSARWRDEVLALMAEG